MPEANDWGAALGHPRPSPSSIPLAAPTSGPALVSPPCSAAPRCGSAFRVLDRCRQRSPRPPGAALPRTAWGGRGQSPPRPPAGRQRARPVRWSGRPSRETSLAAEQWRQFFQRGGHDGGSGGVAPRAVRPSLSQNFGWGATLAHHYSFSPPPHSYPAARGAPPSLPSWTLPPALPPPLRLGVQSP